MDVTVVLEGGRVGEELGSMALIELGSALAAVTATRDDGSGGSRRDGFTPAWTDHAVPPATPGSDPSRVRAPRRAVPVARVRARGGRVGAR